MDEIKLQGGVAVVTGAGSGIGRSIAHALAKAGTDLVIADLELENAEVVCKEIKELGRRAIAVQVDVANEESVNALADRTYKEFDKVTVLCNNAGVNLRPFRAWWDTSTSDMKWLFNVNVFGVYYGIKAFVPRMMQNPERSHIVNTSSLAALLDIAGAGAYSATKGAVDAMSATLRSELETRNIGVSNLMPGQIDTRVATSERLRPKEDQSVERGVKPYSPNVNPTANTSNTSNTSNIASFTGGEMAKGSENVFAKVDVMDVGPMVVEAIRQNRHYIFTHPAVVGAIDARAEKLRNAYQPVKKD